MKYKTFLIIFKGLCLRPKSVPLKAIELHICEIKLLNSELYLSLELYFVYVYKIDGKWHSAEGKGEFCYCFLGLDPW